MSGTTCLGQERNYIIKTNWNEYHPNWCELSALPKIEVFIEWFDRICRKEEMISFLE